jgi:multidrug efflux pump subunit AcrA (membrane-fusion protein)
MSTEKVKELLLQLCNNDTELKDLACKALVQAAKAYKSSRPLIDGRRRRSKPLIAEDRKQLKKLQRALEAARAAAQALSINALFMFCDAYENPIGKLIMELNAAAPAAERATEAARRKSDRTADFERTVLAYDVACVFRDILKKRPKSTRDRAENITSKRGGAAYARVLRVTLKLAGVANVDIGPLIDAGLHLLSDDALPQNAND